ncbi:hypothetical protein [Thalassospira profundimaris]|uniref:Uncharacterized protein n=1 Tax=Thalassospira profundimaris TaxID=502049 RepID=A0A367WS48_9PROT|nr:hypothetical protein [Thalassospira profundimaris]RCK44039.1 hypothetical protein TH30_16905 [Thalassospira profundimaris]
MESNLRDAALAHAPFFITAPGETDILFVGVVWFVVIAVFLIGAFYLNLHALPERLAHHANHTQLQLIGVLTLLALFTHNNIFWVAALVLAVIQFPDFVSPVQTMANALKSMAQARTGQAESTASAPVQPQPASSEPVAASTPVATDESTKQENQKDV